jgi:hypothetical protein
MRLGCKNIAGVILSVLGTWSLSSADFKLNVESRHISKLCVSRPGLVSHLHTTDMEFPEITFSVSATTTGYSIVRHTKKNSRRSKKEGDGLAVALKAVDPAESGSVLSSTTLDTCTASNQALAALEDAIPAIIKEQISSPRAHIDEPTTCPARPTSGSAADDGRSQESSSPSSSSDASDAEDETEMMQALGLPVHPDSYRPSS